MKQEQTDLSKRYLDLFMKDARKLLKGRWAISCVEFENTDSPSNSLIVVSLGTKTKPAPLKSRRWTNFQKPVRGKSSWVTFYHTYPHEWDMFLRIKLWAKRKLGEVLPITIVSHSEANS